MAEINISRESDELIEMFCEYCYENGNKTQPASGFCVNCVKYFCATCLKYHQTFLPDHVHQEKDSMPLDVYLERCNQHTEELVKFYCLSCKDTACSKCKTTFHVTCKEIHHLPKLALEFDKEKEFSDIESCLDLLEKEVANIEHTIVNDKQRTEQYKAEAISALRKQKEEVDKIFDNFELDIEKIHTENENLLDLEENSKDLLKNDIKKLKIETEQLKRSSKKCQTFLKVIELEDERKQVQERLMRMKTRLEQEICQYRYKLASRKLKPEDFGRVVVLPQQVAKMNKIPWCMVLLILAFSVIFSLPILTSDTHISVEKLSDIEVNIQRWKVCYFSEQSLLILDTSEDILHVYNPTDSKWTAQIHIAQLTDITRVRADTVAASFSFTGVVELWSMSSSQSDFSWKLVKRINVGKNCQFTQYRLGKLYVLCPDSRQKIMMKIFDDTYGNKLKSFMIGFTTYGMTASPDGQTIYISNVKDHSLVSYTADGEVTAQYRNGSLKHPAGMTVDRMGNLLVCGFSSQNIFYISADLTYGYELLNRSHGVKDHPLRITYNERESILYVSSTSSSAIQVFKIYIQ